MSKPGKRFDSRDGKLLVAGAVEIKSGKNEKPTLGRVRLAAITDYSADLLHAFMKGSIAPDSTARTDGLTSYLGAPGVTHEPHVIGPMAAHMVMPAIHRVFSNLKTWALGVYRGLHCKYLKTYLDEFAFRFNRRKTRRAAFATLLGIATAIKPINYKMLNASGSTG